MSNSRNESIAISLGNVRSVNRLVMSDQVEWLSRRWSIELSGFGSCFGSEDVLFEYLVR